MNIKTSRNNKSIQNLRKDFLACAILCLCTIALPSYAADQDSDGIDDGLDNCRLVPNPAQRDTNADGFGNICDPDLNNDGIVNFLDLGIMRSVLFTADPDADLNGDGAVNFVDLGTMRSMLFQTPGPGGYLIGTWGYGRLKHRNSGTWAAKSGKVTYNANGTGSSVWQENDNNIFKSGTSTWNWTATTNPDGSITLIRTFPDSSIKTQRFVISDEGMVMIMDGTGNLNNQRFRVAIRMDTTKTYSDADFNGEYYYIEYGNDVIYHRALSAELNADGMGDVTITGAANVDGIIEYFSFIAPYVVYADGSLSIEGDPAAERHLNGNNLVGAKTTYIDEWDVYFGIKKADRSYATSDLAGTWALMSFQDDNNGTSYASTFGSMVCDSIGNCTGTEKIQRDGVATIEPGSPPVLTVMADGSFGTSIGPGTPAYAGAIGNDGNVFIANPSFEDTIIRNTIVGIRCSTCTELARGGGPGLTQLTDNPANDWHSYWSPDGTKITFTSNRSGNNDIWVMDADGSNPVQLTTNAASDSRPYWSPDGSQIVFHSDRSGNEEIWKMNVDGSGLTQLTDNLASDTHPTWSPDGSRIAFHSNRDGNHDIWTMNTDGSGLAKLTTNTANDTHPMWKPDGTQITFTRTLGSRDIWVMNVDGSNQQALTNDPADEQHADWSPDGMKLALRSNKAGNYDVWVMDADGTNPQQITTHPASDRNPDWSPDGTKIMFRSDRSGNNEIWTYVLP